VAVFASGGMSHFVIDEEFDRAFVAALKRRDKDFLTSIPLKELQSGTSELNPGSRLLVSSRYECRHAQDRHVPCYRSPAGTGMANGFIGGHQPLKSSALTAGTCGKLIARANQSAVVDAHIVCMFNPRQSL